MVRRVFSGLDEEGCIRRGTVVADPCTGFGRTSRIAHEFGSNFVGTELDERRLNRAVKWLIDRGYRP